MIAGFFFGRLAGGVKGGSILVMEEDFDEAFFVSVRRCFSADGLDAFASAFEPEIGEIR